jgi:hypothetical protein
MVKCGTSYSRTGRGSRTRDAARLHSPAHARPSVSRLLRIRVRGGPPSLWACRCPCSRALTATIGQAARVTGGLCACNTAGAAIGALAATWLLLPAFGLEITLRISAFVNACAAAGALPPALAVPRTRVRHPDVQAYYRQSGVDTGAVLAPYLERRPRVFGPADDRSAIVDINTDLYPKDEFSVPPARAVTGARPQAATASSTASADRR